MNINPDQCTITQAFGANANPSYAGSGLKGHTGIDTVCGFGTPIHSPVDMYVYKVLTKENPAHDGSGFTGVFGIVAGGIESYEYLIGHCDPTVQVGQVVHMGDVVGTEANHGIIFSGGKQITLEMQAAGSQDGHHRHDQKRPVMQVFQTRPGYCYLDSYSDNAAGSIYRDLGGHYYEIWNYNNGYNGCIDPTKSVFQRDLSVGIGNSGYDVYVLQNILIKEGVASFAPTGFFGNLTLAAVTKLQGKLGITPDAGYFGPRTRAAVQAKYNV